MDNKNLVLYKYDIREVENWYACRYQKLMKAQKHNLAEQGKPTDYLVLYDMVGEEMNLKQTES